MDRRLRVAVIREELVALTGHYVSALFLNQFLYWTENSFHIDEHIQEEMGEGGADLLTLGWIYKSATQLSEETMLGLTATTTGKYLDSLVDRGWLAKRRNPTKAYDRTFQYRVMVGRLKEDLEKLGYSLPGYKLSAPFPKNGNGIPKNGNGIPKNGNQFPKNGEQYHRVIESKEENSDTAYHGLAGDTPQVEPIKESSETPPVPVSPPKTIMAKHPAIQAWVSIHNKYPSKVVWEEIILALGDSPNIQVLKKVCSAWNSRGYKPTNIAAQLEWYGLAMRSSHPMSWSPPKFGGGAAVKIRADNHVIPVSDKVEPGFYSLEDLGL